MKKFIYLFLIATLLYSCVEDDGLEVEREEKNFYLPYFSAKRGNEIVTLALTDPRPLTSYVPGGIPVAPDFVEIYMSENGTDFELYDQVDSTVFNVEVGDLKNNQLYYFKIRSIRVGQESKESWTLLTSPKEEKWPAAIIPGLDKYGEFFRFSKDKTYLSYRAFGDDSFETERLFLYNVDSRELSVLAERSYLDNWSKYSNKAIYSTTETIDYTIYTDQIILHDADTGEETVLIDSPESRSVSNMILADQDRKVYFLSSEGAQESYYFNIWEMDLATKERKMIVDLEAIGLASCWELNLSDDEQTFYMDSRKSGERRTIYQYSLVENSSKRLFDLSIEATRPRISPDGNKVAFISDASGEDEIWVYRMDTGSFSQVTGDEFYDFDHRGNPMHWLNSNELGISYYSQLSKGEVLTSVSID
ncbi:MAG: hypothetical protein AAFQ94_00040 [Bacteroidota bacterium]